MPKVISKKTRVVDRHISRNDIKSFKRGDHYQLYKKLGVHAKVIKGKKGYYFSVWSPDVQKVSVIGDFNGWKKTAHVLNQRHNGSGIWEGFVPLAKRGDRYEYHISTKKKSFNKYDPFSYSYAPTPGHSSRICDLKYRWQDQLWMKSRGKKTKENKPMSIYEVHLGSWKKQEGHKFHTYRQMAKMLPEYVKAMGFTHIEFLPVMEHPFYGSWGYQSLGFFAPSSRYGNPQDFMCLIDSLHQAGIGVILDWVPSHFPCDPHGLSKFNGTCLYEYKELHPDWTSCIFDIGRHEVADFLISSALFWVEKYHIDGIRVDAVASMLYLDYSRGKDQWEPNFFGGYENLESIAFLRQLNQTVKDRFPDVQMMAEESTSWHGVSRSTEKGGLNFDMKWNLGWMHDTLAFFTQGDKSRDQYLKKLTFSLYYAFNENFVLPLSHDEVVHGKSSLLGKMPGDDAQKFANLRCLFSYMYAHPGKKLLFMGSELASWNEWNHDASLDWDLLKYERHKGVLKLIKDLNKLYKKEASLHTLDFDSSGFQWIDYKGKNKGVISFVRFCHKSKEIILVVFNFRNRIRSKLKVGVPKGGSWKEIFNSDDKKYSGQGRLNAKSLKAKKHAAHNQPYSVQINLAPLSITYIKKV